MKICKRLLSGFLAMLILLSSTITSVFAAPESAVATQQSMISFFQTQSQEVDVSKITGNELGVYGVFLSNFFIPGATIIKDVKGDAFATTIKDRFVGGSTTDTLKKIHELIYKMITDSLADDASRLKIGNDNLSGSSLKSAFNTVSKDNKNQVVSTSNGVIFDLKYLRVRAVWSLLFGITPEFFLDADARDGGYAGRGIFNMDSFYIDCFGNIWGKAVGNSPTDYFVLIMPACLNPYMFSENPAGSNMNEIDVRTPVNNAFAMGAMNYFGTSMGTNPSKLSEEIVNGSNDIIKTRRKTLNNPYMKEGAGAPLMSFMNLFLFRDSGKQGNNTFCIYGLNTINSSAIDNPTKKPTSTEISNMVNSKASNKKADGTKEYIMFVYDSHTDSTKWHKNTADWTGGAYIAQCFQNGESDGGNAKGMGALTYLTNTIALDINHVEDTFYWFNFDDKNKKENVEPLTKTGYFNTTQMKLADYVIEQDIFHRQVYTKDSSGAIIVKDGKPEGAQSYIATLPSPFLYLLSKDGSSDSSVDAELDKLGRFHWDDKNTDKQHEDDGSYVYSGHLRSHIMKAESEKFDNPSESGSNKKGGKYHPLFWNIDEKNALGGWETNIFRGAAVIWQSDIATDEDSIWKQVATDEISLFIGAPNSWTDRYQRLVDSYYTTGLPYSKDYPTFADVAYSSIWKGFTADEIVLKALTGDKPGTKKVYNYASKNGDTVNTDGKRTYKLYNFIANQVNAWPSIYWAYTMKLLNVQFTKNDTEDTADDITMGKFEFPHLPQSEIFQSGATTDTLQEIQDAAEAENAAAEEFETAEDKQNKLLDTALELVKEGDSPTRNNIILNTLNGWLVSTHKAITGSDHATNLTGNVSVSRSTATTSKASYSSIVGYISTPKLSDVPFTSWVLDNYLYIYIFLMTLIAICLVMMVLTNVRTWQQGVLLFVLMAFVLVLPQTLLNNAIILGNKFADAMFSDRFLYWAIAEHESDLSEAKLAKAQGDVEDIIQQNMFKAEVAYDHEGTGVKVKWMSPKRYTMFDTLFTDVLGGTVLEQNLTMFKWLFSSFFTGDEYVTDDPFATYVYRSYTDIASDAKKYYDDAKGGSVVSVGDIRTKVKDAYDASALPEDNGTRLKFIGADYYIDNTGEAGVYNGIFDIYGHSDSAGNFDSSHPMNVHTGYGWKQAHLIYISKGYSSDATQRNNEIMSNLVTSGGTIDQSMGTWSHRYWHLTDDIVINSIFKDGTDYTDPGINVPDDSMSPGLRMYCAYAESPYYYFYNVLRERFRSNETDGFKKSMLMDSSFIHNASGLYTDGELRDFLDMEGLFTTVIPIMYQGNQYVQTYIDTYGSEVESYDFNSYKGATGSDFDEAKERKEKLKQVWMMYCPWVDYMYELDVANEKVQWGGQRVTIGDALNPGFYDEANRPMIYSKADMSAKHAHESNLSTVELRIQSVLDKTYKDMLYLLNYYDFNDDALIAAAAMSATFNFNAEFSGGSIAGENTTIYPQSYELKNFNYDAFLRLAMMNATGIPLTNSDIDIYATILNNTSWWTGILIIIEDLLACYAIPACKTAILLLLLYLGLIFCVACVVDKPEKVLKSLGSHILLPTALFLLCNMAFALVISMFTGEGLTSYVGSKTANISMQDPTVTVVLLIVVSGIYMYGLVKLLLHVFKLFKQYGAGVIASVAGLAMATGGMLFNNIRGMANGTGRMMRSGIRRHQMRKDMRDAFGGGVGGSGGGAGSGSGSPKTSNQNRGTGGSKWSNMKNSINDKAAKFGQSVSNGWSKVKDGKIGQKAVRIAKRVKQDGLMLSATKAATHAGDALREGTHKVGDIIRSGKTAWKHKGEIAHAAAMKAKSGYGQAKELVKSKSKKALDAVKSKPVAAVRKLKQKWTSGVTKSKNYTRTRRAIQVQQANKNLHDAKKAYNTAQKGGSLRDRMRAETNLASARKRAAGASKRWKNVKGSSSAKKVTKGAKPPKSK